MEYLEKINEFKLLQNNKCKLCECEMEKPYPDTDMDEGIFFSLLCFDCWGIVTSCGFDIDFLIKIRKYLQYRNRILKKFKEE